jgi:hypothetical protein
MEVRNIEDIRARLVESRELIGEALAATNTREMAEHAVAAQATEAGLRILLDDFLTNPFALYDSHLDRADLEPARNALGDAIVAGEAVALGVDLSTMRARVEEFQAQTEQAIGSIAAVFGLGDV